MHSHRRVKCKKSVIPSDACIGQTGIVWRSPVPAQVSRDCGHLSLALKKDVLSWGAEVLMPAFHSLWTHSTVLGLGREKTVWEEKCCIKSSVQASGEQQGLWGRLSQRFAPKELPTPAALPGITDRCPAQHRALLHPWWAAQRHSLLFDTPALFTTGGILADRTCSA